MADNSQTDSEMCAWRICRRATAATILWLSLVTSAVHSQKVKSGDTQSWWKHAVFYEVYPRSFADSNNDGIGDLNGITSKLTYLHDLGVDAIWISPCFPSPQKDFGYDVSNYTDIDPMYGTLANFDRVQAVASAQNIRIILDYVPNHTSDQHPWFLDSRSSRTSSKRDWYIWRDGSSPGTPPNNWISDFSGSAWKLDAKTQQYYYHYFEVQQPDLNWRNPAVRTAMFDVMRFWYSHGVSGFRLDAVDTLFEDPSLRDNPMKPGAPESGDQEVENRYNGNLPENHNVLRQFRKIADQHNAVLIGETLTDDIASLKAYYGAKHDEIQMPMDFLFMSVPEFSAPKFRAQIAAMEASNEWPVYVMSNHDRTRAYTRYGDGSNNDAIAKVLAGMYLTLRGTPIMYYGEEIGMENNDPKRKEDVIDPFGLSNWTTNKGRDGERTPMQWTSGPNAGFSIAKPWLPVPPSASTHNVASELADPGSVLNFYRRLLALRRSHSALLDGEYVPLAKDNPHVLMYLRRTKDETVLVALNFSASTESVTTDLTSGFTTAKTLLSTTSPVWTDQVRPVLKLDPYSAYIAELQSAP